jgi:checkpoint serine/threonine-protein kinase
VDASQFEANADAMALIFPDYQPTTSVPDPLLPWLWFCLSPSLSRTQTSHAGFRCVELVAVCCGSRSIKKALEEGSRSELDLSKLLSDCVVTFKGNDQYRNDVRFLKIWFLYVISYSSVNFFVSVIRLLELCFQFLYVFIGC